jgi:hypothetical protein
MAQEMPRISQKPVLDVAVNCGAKASLPLPCFRGCNLVWEFMEAVLPHFAMWGKPAQGVEQP